MHSFFPLFPLPYYLSRPPPLKISSPPPPTENSLPAIFFSVCFWHFKPLLPTSSKKCKHSPAGSNRNHIKVKHTDGGVRNQSACFLFCKKQAAIMSVWEIKIMQNNAVKQHQMQWHIIIVKWLKNWFKKYQKWPFGRLLRYKTLCTVYWTHHNFLM